LKRWLHYFISTWKLQLSPQFRLIYRVNDAKQLLTILPVATRDDVYEELREMLGA